MTPYGTALITSSGFTALLKINEDRKLRDRHYDCEIQEPAGGFEFCCGRAREIRKNECPFLAGPAGKKWALPVGPYLELDMLGCWLASYCSSSRAVRLPLK